MDYPKSGKSSFDTLPVDSTQAASKSESTADKQQRPTPAANMAYVWRTSVVLLLCLLVLLGVASGSPAVPCPRDASKQQAVADSSDADWFASMLRSASPASLHELLHRFLPGKFQDGVFPSDRAAVEAVHRTDPALATSILRLARRDEPNSTVTRVSSSQNPTPTPTDTDTTTDTTTDTDEESSTSEPPIETSTSRDRQPPPTTTTSTTSTTSTSSTDIETSSPSTPRPDTTTSDETTPPPPPPTTSLPGTSSSISEPTSTFSPTPSSELVTSSPPPSSSRETLPSSSLVGDTTLTTTTRPPTTTTPPRTSKEVVTTFTSTSPDGAVVTVTTVTWVPAEVSETAVPGSDNPPTLQNLASRGSGSGSIVAGVVGFAMLLLLV